LADPTLGPIAGFFRDIFVYSYNTINNHNWLICGGGQSGVTTLIRALETDSDVIPTPDSTVDKVPMRSIKAHAQLADRSMKLRLKAADMRNQPDGRWQYLEEIIKKPIGVVYVFRTYEEKNKQVIEAPHISPYMDKFDRNNGHNMFNPDYEQFEFITNAMLNPSSIEEKYREIFEEASLHSDIRHRYMNKFKGWVPQVLLMVANFRDATFQMGEYQNEFQAKTAEETYLNKYKQIFEPLTNQWQITPRNWGVFNKKYITIKYVSISAKYNIGMGNLLALMGNKTNLLAGG